MEDTHADIISDSKKNSPVFIMRVGNSSDVSEVLRNHESAKAESEFNGNNYEENSRKKPHQNHMELESVHASHLHLNQQMSTLADGSVSAELEAAPCINTYQQKKNLAQGMMDLALLSANASQLRYVLESSAKHAYYYPSLALISLSLVLQIAVGVGLILNGRCNVNNEHELRSAVKINNMTVLGVFLVTLVNVFISSFSVATPPAV